VQINAAMVENGKPGAIEIFEVIPVPYNLQGVEIVKRHGHLDLMTGIAFGAHCPNGFPFLESIGKPSADMAAKRLPIYPASR
jgi:hypothetical protein